MTDVRQMFFELLDSDAFADLVDEAAAWVMRRDYDRNNPNMITHEADRRDAVVIREAARIMHNYHKPPDEHIDD